VSDQLARQKQNDKDVDMLSSYPDIYLINEALDDGADINVKGARGLPLLMHACLEGMNELADFLLDHGADPSLGSDSGETPLHGAAKTGDSQLIERLLLSGADIEASDGLSGTPLYVACSYNNNEAAKYLVDRGADVEAIRKLSGRQYVELHRYAERGLLRNSLADKKQLDNEPPGL